MGFNLNNLLKYLIMFTVTTLSTRIIPTCGVLKQQAVYVGLISASTFALIDICSPHIILEKPYYSDESKCSLCAHQLSPVKF